MKWVTDPFPYPEGLTQLGELELTDLERKVASNQSFQALRSGFPHWGELTTGLQYHNDLNHDKFNPSKVLPSPSAVRDFAVDFTKNLIGLVVLAAQVRRDYNGHGKLTGYCDPEWEKPNARLLHDLTRFLDSDPHFDGFRWEEHWGLLRYHAIKNSWAERVAQFRASGYSELIVLLCSDLSLDRSRELYDQLIAGCRAAKRLPAKATRERLIPYLPMTYCACCDQERLHNPEGSVMYPGPPKHSWTIPLVDCGDVAGVLKWITDRPLRRAIRPVRFSLPHATFIDSEKEELMSAGLLIFDLERLPSASRQMVIRRLEKLLSDHHKVEEAEAPERARNNWSPSTGWRDTRILRPEGKQQLRAILVAGHGDSISRWNYKEAFKQGELFRLIREGMSVTATYTP